ncbi:hypothetical protein [Nannocystis punicea]|uniref:Thaumatin family protein n=1 Tax=Nannocystis punicea TaxID=2995304 RepID=A0ABY7GX56_9BACT|nr:hypothetical protein [Nannocystis poenicansa]WAS91568.1 hypothetical protein O0S08_35760 [Nannocystis poenicansa]
MNRHSSNHHTIHPLLFALAVAACGDADSDEVAARNLVIGPIVETGEFTSGPWTTTGTSGTTRTSGTTTTSGGDDTTTGGDDTTTGAGDTGSDDTGTGSTTGGVCTPTLHTLNAFVEGSDMLADGPQNPPPNYPPGWIDRIELETSTQCNFQNWKDSDGVDPETPGCHYAFEDKDCETPTNDKFGESCQDGDILVETNPGKDVCHAHALGPGNIGVGHPDRFSCNAYCTAKYDLPGECRTTQDTCGPGVGSAYCLCGC